MNEFTKLTNGKELIVRKKLSSFIEKNLRYLEYDFRHDLFKKIIYGEEEFKTPLEEMIKNYYDAYFYLLSNHKNPFTKELLNRFFFIINGKIPNQTMVIKLVTHFFFYMNLPPLDASINFHLVAYKEMKCLEEKERFIISLMFLNYTLLKFDIPTIYFVRKDFSKYEKAKREYFLGNKKEIYNFFLEIISNFKFQNKDYYQNLKPLTFKDIYNIISFDKERLIKEFEIKHLFVYGSFSKGEERIDSDIDLLISFNLDLTRVRKIEIIDHLTKYYFDKFNRYLDFMELGEYLNDELIKETTSIKKIF